MKTLGGRQFWGDVLHFRGWRIQQNVYTKHFRLLDARDSRHAWGSREECLEKLREIREQQQLPPLRGKAAIILHGIMRSSKSMGRLRTALIESGYEAIGFDYPSTRVDIDQSAEYLHQTIESLEGITELNLVVHSLGGIIVRNYLKNHHDPRLKRMVMMGVPNRGARLADLLKKNTLFRLILGPAGQQLISDPQAVINQLPIPDFDFGVIAGARGTESGYNPLIAGDDDGIVSLSSARLPGATDFVTVRCLHSFLMMHRPAIEYARRYLDTGAFRENNDREPIQED